MSAPVTIDGAEFARREECVEGEAPLAALVRLHDVLADTDGVVAYRLAGRVRRDGKPCIDVTVAGAVRVTCQRCLQPVKIDLEGSRKLVFVPGSTLGDFEDEEEDTDYLPSEDRVSPMELVVDEILLAMPIAPRHAEHECLVHLPFETGQATGSQFLN
jgi:uncharacterized protein